MKITIFGAGTSTLADYFAAKNNFIHVEADLSSCWLKPRLFLLKDEFLLNEII